MRYLRRYMATWSKSKLGILQLYLLHNNDIHWIDLASFKIDHSCTFASNSVNPFSKTSRGPKPTQSRTFEAKPEYDIIVSNWIHKETLFNVDRMRVLCKSQCGYAATLQRHFRRYLHKSRISRLSKPHNTQPTASIFNFNLIIHSDGVGFNVDIIFTMQSLTTHISLICTLAVESTARVSDGFSFITYCARRR